MTWKTPVNQDPSERETQRGFAKELAQKGDDDGAIEIWKSLLQQGPGDPPVQDLLAEAFSRKELMMGQLSFASRF